MSADTVLRSTAGRLGWKIDTRGHGGFIIGAGSRRRDGRYRVTRNREIAPLPSWLVDALTPATPRPEPGERPTRPPRTHRRYLQAILTGESDAVACAQPGTRHTTLLSAACTLGRLVAGGELDDHDARSALRRAAACHVGIDGMSQREVTDTINDGIQYGSQRPRRLTD
jgi:bifunctional DNA primase/polymerase-like protein